MPAGDGRSITDMKLQMRVVLLAITSIISAQAWGTPKSYTDTISEVFDSIYGKEGIDSGDLALLVLKALGVSASKEYLSSADELQKAHPTTKEIKLHFLGDHHGRGGAPVAFDKELPSTELPALMGESSVILIDWLGGHEWAVLVRENGEYRYGSTMYAWTPVSQDEGIDEFIINRAHELWIEEHLNPHHKVEDDLDHEMRIVRVAGGPSHSEL